MDVSPVATLLATQAAISLVAVKAAADQQAAIAQMLAQLAEAAKSANLPDHLGRNVNTTA